MRVVRRMITWAVVLAAMPVLASAPKVALHPLEDPQETGPELAADRAELARAAAGVVQVADPAAVLAWLGSLPGESCQAKPECLARLATQTGADAALYVSLNTYAPTVKVYWVLVSAGGNQIQSGRFEGEKKGTLRRRWVKSALARLFNDELPSSLSTLGEGKALAPRPVATPASARPTSASADPVPPSRGGVDLAPHAHTGESALPSSAGEGGKTAWMRPAALGVGAAGVAALVAGVLVGHSAVSGWDDALAQAGQYPTASERARLLEERSTYEGRASIGNALKVGGGVALTAGAALFAFDLLRSRRGPVSVSLGAGDHALWVEGRFP